jgi:hypothetical protein
MILDELVLRVVLIGTAVAFGRESDFRDVEWCVGLFGNWFMSHTYL